MATQNPGHSKRESIALQETSDSSHHQGDAGRRDENQVPTSRQRCLTITIIVLVISISAAIAAFTFVLKEIGDIKAELEALKQDNASDPKDDINANIEKLSQEFLPDINEWEQKAKDLARLLNSTRQHLNDSLNKRIQELNDSFSERLGSVRQIVAQSVAKYLLDMRKLDTALNQDIQEIDATFDKRIEFLERKETEHATDVNITTVLLKSLSKRIEKVNATLGEKVEQLQQSEHEKNLDIYKKIKNVQENQTKVFAKKLLTLDDTMTRKVRELNETYIKMIEESQEIGNDRLAAEVQALSTDVKRKVQEMNITCNEKIRNLRQTTKQQNEGFDEKLQTLDYVMAEKLGALNNTLHDTVYETHQAGYERWKSEIQALENTLKRQIQEVNLTCFSKVQDLRQWTIQHVMILNETVVTQHDIVLTLNATFNKKVWELQHSQQLQHEHIDRKMKEGHENQTREFQANAQALDDVFTLKILQLNHSLLEKVWESQQKGYDRCSEDVQALNVSMKEKVNEMSTSSFERIHILQQANIDINDSLRTELQALGNNWMERVQQINLTLTDEVHKLHQVAGNLANESSVKLQALDTVIKTLVGELNDTLRATALKLEQVDYEQSKTLNEDVEKLKRADQEQKTSLTEMMDLTIHNYTNVLLSKMEELLSTEQDRLTNLSTLVASVYEDATKAAAAADMALFFVKATTNTVDDLSDKFALLQKDVQDMKSSNEQGRSRREAGLPLTESVVRLVGGGRNYGRVEVFYREEWGTVCDDKWDIRDGNVVCKMLGYARASTVYEAARYCQGTGPIWLDDVDCNGTESSIFECSKRAWGMHDCDHSEDASVRCEFV